MTQKRYVFLILILGSLTALTPFSIDMYLPGFKAIAINFKVQPQEVALTLSSFFIGVSAGQLLYGPLLDRFGRKRPLYFGLSLYIIASIGCFFSTSLETLVIMRLFQAIGSCAAGVASLAMVRDLFPVEDNAKVFALLILVLGASPMIAPSVGTFITKHFEWQVIFLILAIIAAIILLVVIFFLPESYQPDPAYSLKPGPILGHFWEVLKQPQFTTYALCGAFVFAGLFAYVSSASFVFIEVYKVSNDVFGWLFAGLSVGFIGSSQVNTIMMRKYKSEQMVNVSLICMVIISLAFLVASLNGWLAIPGTIAMIFGVLCCVGICAPNTSALSLAPFTKNAGSASALLGAFQMAIGALVSIGITLIKSNSALPMAAVMAASAIIALLILLIGKGFIKDKVEASAGGTVAMH